MWFRKVFFKEILKSCFKWHKIGNINVGIMKVWYLKINLISNWILKLFGFYTKLKELYIKMTFKNWFSFYLKKYNENDEEYEEYE